MEVVTAQNTTIPVNVGVVLDLDSWVGKLGLSCIEMALQDFYSNHGNYRTRLVLHTRDSERDVVGAAAAALDLINNVRVQTIIGPTNSMEANFVISLGNKSQVPIMSFSATSPSLTSIRSPYFFRATQNDSSQVRAISAIIQAFGWREAVPICEDNEFGEGLIPYLSDALEDVNARIPYRCVISPGATDEEIKGELYELMTMQTRVFIVHMAPSLGCRVFNIGEEIGMMTEGYVWIMTDGLTNHRSLMDCWDMDSKLQGVLGVRSYIPKSKKLDNFKLRWKRKFLQDNSSMVNAELDISGLWAYDATFALAMAVEQLGTANFGFDMSNVPQTIRTELQSIGVSQNGPKLIQTLSNTRFKGLSGEFGFTNGQLKSSAFQIVNGERGIGFWTSKYGLVKKLNFTNVTRYSTSRENLGTIIWPGDSNTVPKGWEIPTNGKRLKIGVPVKDGSSVFVKEMLDPSTNSTIITGYSIDVFNAVMDAMPYAVTYDFISFKNSDGKMTGSYDDLVYQVFLRNYDAVVGDISIVVNRSLYVDFTLPYTESGVVMVVPIQGDSKKNAWVFLKPLTWDLWVTSACFFVFIGFVVWVLEHRISEDFRGPPLHQIGTSLSFSLQTVVFAQRERVVGNPGRFVVVIWCFVVFILTQSYTASLTSLLTVQRLQPMVTDVSELMKKGQNVGYPYRSFVEGLVRRLRLDPSKMKKYKSLEGLDELFSNGSIAAAFDEIPYIKLFLAKHCDKYTTVGPTFKTDGFGFAFPRGSPLVADVNRAILNVAESDKLREIENTWFQTQTSCTNSTPSVSSNSLSLESFLGLFLVAGTAAIFTLIIFVAEFLYKQKDVWLDSEASVRNKILKLSRIFNAKDLSSHTFRQSYEGSRRDSGVHV
ncbi:hypothetical protein SLA2020_183710 [Shorea laevis]